MKVWGHPMTERRGGAQPLALEAAAAPAGHLGIGSGLIDEDQAMRLELGMAPPIGRQWPLSRQVCISLTTNDTDTLKCDAASWHDCPPATNATARSLRSIE